MPAMISVTAASHNSLRRGMREIGPVGARGDLDPVHRKRAADRHDPELLLLLVDEMTDQLCRGSYSRAEKPVAALSVSIVCSISRFLRFSSRTCADSAVLVPGAVPSSTSAWRSHLRSVSGVIPSRLATAVI